MYIKLNTKAALFPSLLKKTKGAINSMRNVNQNYVWTGTFIIEPPLFGCISECQGYKGGVEAFSLFSKPEMFDAVVRKITHRKD